MTDNELPRELVGDFHVTDSRAGYWYVRCRLCKAAWHLPQEAGRRAAEAMGSFASTRTRTATVRPSQPRRGRQRCGRNRRPCARRGGA